MAKKYFTRYFIETPNAVGNRKNIETGKILGWKFNFGTNEISLYDHKQGLWADCYIKSESPELAEVNSKNFVENVLNLIDFSTSSASNFPLFISIYDATENLANRFFKQIFYVSLPERNVTQIDKEIFEEVFNKFNKYQDARITRAISWLRKGYLEQGSIDKFVAFWIGLESINELLCNFFKISEEDRKIKCNKCGNEISSISSAGVKKLFIDTLNIEIRKFEEIRGARGKLLHGGGPIDNNFAEKIKEYIPVVKKALIKGIGMLLQLDNEIIEKIIGQKSRLYNETIRLVIKAKLVNFNLPDLSEFGKQPKIDLEKKRL